MSFSCHCCNIEFKTSSNLQKHMLTATHGRIQAKLQAEPSENVILRNRIETLERENILQKNRIDELEKQVQKTNQIVNQIVQVVQKVTKINIEPIEDVPINIGPIEEVPIVEPIEQVPIEVEPIESVPIESVPIEKVIYKRSIPKKSVPKTKTKTTPATKLKKKDFDYLTNKDLQFISENEIDDEGANQIDSVKSIISYHIQENDIIEPILTEVQELMIPYILDSPCVKQWKTFMKDEVMQTIKKLKKPTRRELISKNYSELTLDDIEFVVENDLQHEDITQMDLIRHVFKGEAHEKTKEQFLKIQPDDSDAFKKWKTSFIT